MVKQLIRGPCHAPGCIVAVCLVRTSAGSAVPKGPWRQGGQRDCCCCRFVDRKLNRSVCVLIGFVTFELPEPNGDGKARYLVNLLSYHGPYMRSIYGSTRKACSCVEGNTPVLS